MAFGCIPIVTDVAGTKEDIVDMDNGYIIPVGDYSLMAKRIKEIDQNRKLLEIMGPKKSQSNKR